jgi:mono/diheme cytochrome c family protein
MKTVFTLAASLIIVAFMGFYQCQNAEAKPSTDSINTKSQEEMVARGKYLAGVLACDDCHTPKIMTAQGPDLDMSRRFMGHPGDEVYQVANKKEMTLKENVAVFSAGMTAIAGPWGVSYAANLTPDETGTGNWTEAQFLKAIKEGKTKGLDGTRPILPPMPWQVYRNLTDEDLKAIYAFLRTVKPQKNVVPNPKMWDNM